MTRAQRTEVLQGTLDLIVLKTLDITGPMHGWGIARRIEQVSGEQLQMNQGTIYPALIRLEQKRFIVSKWSVSENNRRAKFYSITKAGRNQLELESRNWDVVSAMMARLLRGSAEEV